jgi:hypothetical protein
VDTARDKHTLDSIEAEELWNVAVVDRNGYLCRGCKTGVFAASYDRKKNKKRPYFTLGPVNKHEFGCNVDGEETIVKRGKIERVGKSEGFPLPFPSRLTLSDERPVAPGGSEVTAELGRGRAESRGGAGAAPGDHHGHTVKTIRPACRTFINFPHDRDHLPLTIPNVSGRTYAEVFWHLRSRKSSHFKVLRHLYYATIRWKAKPTITEMYCELTLNVGEWDSGRNDYKSLSRVRVDWSVWSQTRRDSLIREFEATREEAAEKARENSQVKGWLFFVGTQDEIDPEVFHVDDYRLVCSLPAELIWPATGSDDGGM